MGTRRLRWPGPRRSRSVEALRSSQACSGWRPARGCHCSRKWVMTSLGLRGSIGLWSRPAPGGKPIGVPQRRQSPGCVTSTVGQMLETENLSVARLVPDAVASRLGWAVGGPSRYWATWGRPSRRAGPSSHSKRSTRSRCRSTSRARQRVCPSGSAWLATAATNATPLEARTKPILRQAIPHAIACSR